MTQKICYIYFFVSPKNKFFWPKIFLTNFFWAKIFLTNFFWPNTFLNPNIFCPELFWSNIILPDIFFDHQFLHQFFWTNNSVTKFLEYIFNNQNSSLTTTVLPYNLKTKGWLQIYVKWTQPNDLKSTHLATDDILYLTVNCYRNSLQ